METAPDKLPPRVATADDANDLAVLLDDFNTEFGTPSPGVEALASRLAALLAASSTFAVVAGSPARAVGLVTLRTNVWYAGQVALLDEMYVVPDLRGQGVGSAIIERLVATCDAKGVDLIEINVDEGDLDAHRFYERHGFSTTEPGSEERSFYLFRELSTESRNVTGEAAARSGEGRSHSGTSASVRRRNA